MVKLSESLNESGNSIKKILIGKMLGIELKIKLKLIV